MVESEEHQQKIALYHHPQQQHYSETGDRLRILPLQKHSSRYASPLNHSPVSPVPAELLQESDSYGCINILQMNRHRLPLPLFPESVIVTSHPANDSSPSDHLRHSTTTDLDPTESDSGSQACEADVNNHYSRISDLHAPVIAASHLAEPWRSLLQLNEDTPRRLQIINHNASDLLCRSVDPAAPSPAMANYSCCTAYDSNYYKAVSDDTLQAMAAHLHHMLQSDAPHGSDHEGCNCSSDKMCDAQTLILHTACEETAAATVAGHVHSQLQQRSSVANAEMELDSFATGGFASYASEFKLRDPYNYDDCWNSEWNYSYGDYCAAATAGDLSSVTAMETSYRKLSAVAAAAAVEELNDHEDGFISGDNADNRYINFDSDYFFKLRRASGTFSDRNRSPPTAITAETCVFSGLIGDSSGMPDTSRPRIYEPLIEPPLPPWLESTGHDDHGGYGAGASAHRACAANTNDRTCTELDQSCRYSTSAASNHHQFSAANPLSTIINDKINLNLLPTTTIGDDEFNHRRSDGLIGASTRGCNPHTVSAVDPYQKQPQFGAIRADRHILCAMNLPSMNLVSSYGVQSSSATTAHAETTCYSDAHPININHTAHSQHNSLISSNSAGKSTVSAVDVLIRPSLSSINNLDVSDDVANNGRYLLSANSSSAHLFRRSILYQAQHEDIYTTRDQLHRRTPSTDADTAIARSREAAHSSYQKLNGMNTVQVLQRFDHLLNLQASMAASRFYAGGAATSAIVGRHFLPADQRSLVLCNNSSVISTDNHEIRGRIWSEQVMIREGTKAAPAMQKSEEIKKNDNNHTQRRNSSIQAAERRQKVREKLEELRLLVPGLTSNRHSHVQELYSSYDSADLFSSCSDKLKPWPLSTTRIPDTAEALKSAADYIRFLHAQVNCLQIERRVEDDIAAGHDCSWRNSTSESHSELPEMMTHTASAQEASQIHRRDNYRSPRSLKRNVTDLDSEECLIIPASASASDRRIQYSVDGNHHSPDHIRYTALPDTTCDCNYIRKGFRSGQHYNQEMIKRRRTTDTNHENFMKVPYSCNIGWIGDSGMQSRMLLHRLLTSPVIQEKLWRRGLYLGTSELQGHLNCKDFSARNKDVVEEIDQKSFAAAHTYDEAADFQQHDEPHDKVVNCADSQN